MGNKTSSHSSSMDNQEAAEDCDKMAAELLGDQDPFSCPICLDPLEEPATIPCGHSYCMACIRDCWDLEEAAGVYSCPQCRQTFRPRPALSKNTMFAEVVERLRQSGLGAARPAGCHAKPGEVACDVCTGRKRRAIKTCLACVASYCELHLRLHNSLNSGLKHTLVDTVSPAVKSCVRHGKKLEAYCRSDQSFICRTCITTDHRGHDIALGSKEHLAPRGHRGGKPTKGADQGGSRHPIGLNSQQREVYQHRCDTGVHVKPGHDRSSGHKKKRKHGGPGHGNTGHKSDEHENWHRHRHHERGNGQAGR